MKMKSSSSNSSSVLSIAVVVLLLLVNVVCVSSSRASVVDTSKYREDWCRGDGSRATRTTGECICLNRHCIGPRCRFEQEFVYYVYSECPACECAKRDASANSKSSNNDGINDGNNDNDYVKTPLPKKTDTTTKKKRFAAVSNYNNENDNNNNNNNMNDNKNDDNDAFYLGEFIEENARVAFAIAFTLLLFGMIINVMYSKSETAIANDAITSKKATDDNKQNDKSD